MHANASQMAISAMDQLTSLFKQAEGTKSKAALVPRDGQKPAWPDENAPVNHSKGLSTPAACGRLCPKH